MKTLNLNKLTILLGLFLVSAFFTTGANAACVESSPGIIKVTYDRLSSGQYLPVNDDGSGELGTGNSEECLSTPIEYKLVFYKYGICKADPSLGNLSSCAFLFKEAAGVEHDIAIGNTEALAIPEFAIEPGIYPFSYVLLSNKLGMKWSGVMQRNTFGKDSGGTISSGTNNTNCWTTGHGPRAAAYQDNSGGAVTTVHGNTLQEGAVLIDCDSTMGTPAFAYEILTRFSEGNCSAALGATGDKQSFGLEGVGQGRGIPTVSLLTAADAFATTCQNSAKIAWTTALTTSITITEDSTFEMSMKATDANSIYWDQGNNNHIIEIGSGAPRIMLTVTN